jgi:hypothetical protein
MATCKHMAFNMSVSDALDNLNIIRATVAQSELRTLRLVCNRNGFFFGEIDASNANER